MSLGRMLPLATMVGVGYTQKDQLGDVMQAPFAIQSLRAILLRLGVQIDQR